MVGKLTFRSLFCCCCSITCSPTLPTQQYVVANSQQQTQSSFSTFFCVCGYITFLWCDRTFYTLCSIKKLLALGIFLPPEKRKIVTKHLNIDNRTAKSLALKCARTFLGSRDPSIIEQTSPWFRISVKVWSSHCMYRAIL